MPDRPLLLFPSHEQIRAARRPAFPGSIHGPSALRQGARLAPIFAELQSAFEGRRVELQAASSGIDPEEVIVFETIGSVDKFITAVQKIPGLEWMGELEVEDIEPDQDFYEEGNPGHPLSGRLYLVMTNQRAMQELLSLWGQYQEREQDRFPHGLAKFKNLFKCLKDVRRWGIQDRLLETNLIGTWSESLRRMGEHPVRFEAELWFRHSDAKRLDCLAVLERQISELGGRVVSQCSIPEIAYHGLLGELPAEIIRSITENPSIESVLSSPAASLIKSESVMFFLPVGQMAVSEEPLDGEFSSCAPTAQPRPTGSPTIGLLDGVPLLHHDLLDGRIYFDDPNGFQSDYQVAEQNHGTAMASTIIHGDLSSPGPALRTPLYIRPILKPNPTARGFGGIQEEMFPEDTLLVDLVHSAIKRMMEGDAVGQSAIAPTVKIINLSIGDRTRQFTRVMSPLGRLLDWLSHQYGLLFVISAGNHPSSVDLEMDLASFEALSDVEREEHIVKHFLRDARNRRLLSPAESLNGLTVGAAHEDGSAAAPSGDRVDPFTTSLPSPISSFGSGHRRAIKPDLVYPGGKLWYRKPFVGRSPVRLTPLYHRTAPGVQVAAPGVSPGERNATSFQCGTSHATALITRAGANCLDTLNEVITDQAPTLDIHSFTAPLVKAMLVHGCSWGEVGARLDGIIRPGRDWREVTSWISRWLGYGQPEITRVLECTAQRATVLGFGSIDHDEAHVFSLPLPPGLSATTQLRRLTITLAWLSPVFPKTQKYRGARLWFDQRHGLVVDRQDADWQTARRGTVQHEVFEGERAVPFSDGDSLKIQVNCVKDAGELSTPIHYGLAVTLEVADGVSIAIYDEIRARIATLIQVQQLVAGQQ